MADVTGNAPSLIDPAKATSGAPAVADAQAKAIEAQAKADEAKKSPEQREADRLRADASKAETEAAAEAAAANAVPIAMTVAEARVLAPVNPGMGAGDHMAQQFRNTPENPKIFKAEHADPEKATVPLVMDAPDHPSGVVTTVVHPEMVGDYLRAGWSRA